MFRLRNVPSSTPRNKDKLEQGSSDWQEHCKSVAFKT